MTGDVGVWLWLSTVCDLLRPYIDLGTLHRYLCTIYEPSGVLAFLPLVALLGQGRGGTVGLGSLEQEVPEFLYWGFLIPYGRGLSRGS